MVKFNSISSILIVTSILMLGSLYFVGLIIPSKHEVISFGYETSFLALIIGYILQHKKIQQLIGLFFYLLFYNLKIIKNGIFKIQNEDILYFARHNTFYVIVVSMIFLLPTLFNEYKFEPLTNRTNVNDSSILLTSIVLIILIQTTIRLIA